MTVLRAFDDYPNEAGLIGRILAGYADIEIGLMHSVKTIRNDHDLALKAMFRGRGNTLRIDVADAMARQRYVDIGLGEEFNRAISSVRHCLSIRNLYAHCTWWSDNSGQLAFANLEELAKQSVVVNDLHDLTVHHVTPAHLQTQFVYLQHTEDTLYGLVHESLRRAGKANIPTVVIPPDIPKPQKYL